MFYRGRHGKRSTKHQRFGIRIIKSGVFRSYFDMGKGRNSPLKAIVEVKIGIKEQIHTGNALFCCFGGLVVTIYILTADNVLTLYTGMVYLKR